MQGEVTLHGWIHSCLSGWKEAQLTCKTTRREVCPRWLIPGSLIDQSRIRRGVYCDMLTARVEVAYIAAAFSVGLSGYRKINRDHMEISAILRA